MIGIKITELPSTSLPYDGSEQIPIVQNNETRTGSISSFASYAATSTNSVRSITTGITGATVITNVVSISQANYNALSAASAIDSTTLYVIPEWN